MFVEDIQIGMVVRSGDRVGAVIQIIPVLTEDNEVSTIEATLEVDFDGFPECIQFHQIDAYIEDDGEEVPYWDEDDTNGFPLI